MHGSNRALIKTVTVARNMKEKIELKAQYVNVFHFSYISAQLLKGSFQVTHYMYGKQQFITTNIQFSKTTKMSMAH